MKHVSERSELQKSRKRRPPRESSPASGELGRLRRQVLLYRCAGIRQQIMDGGENKIEKSKREDIDGTACNR